MIDHDRTSAAGSDFGQYDELTATEQARVRSLWREQIRETISGLDLRAEFEAAGEMWTEADVDGRPVIRGHAHKPATEDGPDL